MTDDYHPKLKYEIIWSDLSDREATDEYGLPQEYIRELRADYGRHEETLQIIRERLEGEQPDLDGQEFLLNVEQGLRFFMFGWFGRPIGGGRVASEAYEDLWRSRAEYMAGAYGKGSKAMVRWYAEVGRTLREAAIE